jgi:hypothetical protein
LDPTARVLGSRDHRKAEEPSTIIKEIAMNIIDSTETVGAAKSGMSDAARTKMSRGVMRGLVCAALIAALPAIAGANEFEVLDNHGDRYFNQLLGINDSRVIVGYFGDGTIVPNNGYVLLPKNHYSVENFTNLPAGDSASQTQAIGINNDTQAPQIVGFYTDAKTGFTHGFLDINGSQMTLDDPLGTGTNVAAPAQNLLSVNDKGQAAGFWTDNNTHLHGFVVAFDQNGKPLSFTEVPASRFKDGVSTQVSGITDEQELCGFYTDKNGNNHGFYGKLDVHYKSFDVVINGVKATNTQAFGCNNNGEIVGQFSDMDGNLHGFLLSSGNFTQFDAPGSSQVPEFGVQGTLINGIDDLGDIVGFFSDGKSAVKGFVTYSND